MIFDENDVCNSDTIFATTEGRYTDPDNFPELVSKLMFILKVSIIKPNYYTLKI